MGRLRDKEVQRKAKMARGLEASLLACRPLVVSCSHWYSWSLSLLKSFSFHRPPLAPWLLGVGHTHTIKFAAQIPSSGLSLWQWLGAGLARSRDWWGGGICRSTPPERGNRGPQNN